MSTKQTQKHRGFVQLIAIILVSLIGTSIALALLPLNLSLVDGMEATNRFFEAQAGAESCGEIALLSLKEDPLFAGPLTYQNGGIDCTAGVTSSTTPFGYTFTIETTGTSRAYTQRVSISGDIASGTAPAITGWAKVVDF